jgi:hypothetical protein
MPRSTSILALLFAFALLLARPPSLAAQNGGPGVGEPVAFVDAEGIARGSITVVEVTDPFEDFHPDYPPEAGSRVVAVTIAFDADAGDRFDVTPFAIVLQDSEGFLWNQGSVFFADDMLIPELTSQTLAPGSRITGVVGFVLPETAEPARVFYQPESSRLIALAELSDTAPPRLGEASELVDSNGGTGTVTVTEIVDPFTDFDPAYPPPDGTRFIALTLVYENPGEGRFDIEPFGLLLRDTAGYLWNPASLFRPTESVVVPDLSSDQLAPGDRRSGVIGFAVPEGVAPGGLYLSPQSGLLLQLAALGDEAGTGAAAPAAAPAASPEAAIAAPAEAVVDEPCVALATWMEATRGRIEETGAMSVEDAALEDLEALRGHGGRYGALAGEQAAAAVPADAAAVNQALVATLRAYESAIEQILTADDPGKETALELTEGVNTFNAAGERLHEIEAEIARLAGGCGLA